MKNIIIYPLSYLVSLFEHIGKYFDLMFKVLRSFTTWHLYMGFLPEHMVKLGVSTIPIVIVTGLFSGMVTSVQTGYQLESGFIPDSYVGGIVGVTVLMELSPMITALVMTGRVGASIAAEIGTMRVSEQIDALETLSFDPISFLIMPRVVSGAIMFPVMIVIADFFGILGGYLAATVSLGISPYDYVYGLRDWFVPWDAIFGVIKAFSFGLAITSIGCYFGFYTVGGAEGVGKSTTQTVVVSCITIVILDYLLAAILL
tara:strand:- start:329 stop:1102 length:774 start_codon:yes stop_codon:yes gene_type:complete